MHSDKVLKGNDNPILEENLPFPYVYYPEFYGAFIGFAKHIDSEIYLCTCMEHAFLNFLELKKLDPDKYNNTNPLRATILDSFYFPVSFSELSVKLGKEVIKLINFYDNVCHLCNNNTPTVEYCHKMYGGLFKRNYGWYIRDSPIKEIM